MHLKMEKDEITVDPSEIQKIIGNYCEKLYTKRNWRILKK